ncbi:DUF6311 domain-containing protein [Rufibacter sp. LB8]|uniref:DUF6311 domain-containing protein n=1 Tax=Rufibacter sp. LB8 TaxID=2777781 RepID=UPI00178C5253|nr:DUF6311 domain-containing protein [Rufibacter sp. LB8]
MNQNRLLFIFSFLAITLLFHLCYGLEVLVPTNINWLLQVKHDWGGHYLGWYNYRVDEWRFPLGQMNNLMAPMGTNVGFTDSIPLFALFFKVLSPVLPEDFQYFGLFMYLSHLLTGYFTILIFNRFGVKPIYTFLAVLFIVANPVLVYRGMHPSLTAQWLFLGSIYLYFADSTVMSARKVLQYQLILLWLSALITPYLCFMVLGFTSFIALKLWWYEKSINAVTFLGYQVLSVVALLVTWFLVGMMFHSTGEDLGVANAFGLYGLNLNALFNSFGLSAYLPQLPWVSGYQYEGYAYLGLGMMALVLFVLVYLLIQKLLTKTDGVKNSLQLNGIALTPLVILVVLYLLFSITHVVSYGDKVLFTVPLPQTILKIGDILRASSRFFWIIYYLIFIFSIAILAKSTLKPAVKIGLLVAALALQFLDTRILFTYRNLAHGAYQAEVDMNHWQSLVGQFDEVVLYPGYQTTNLKAADYQHFTFFTAKARKKINTGYVPRVDAKRMTFLADSLKDELQNGRLSPKALYITTPANLQAFSMVILGGDAQLNYVDGYYYLFSKKRLNPTLRALLAEPGANSKAPVGSAAYENQFAKKRAHLDSVAVAIGKRQEFKKVANLPLSSGSPIRIAVDQLDMRDKFIFVSGFAFLNATDNNRGDSVYVFLQSEKNNYLSAVSVLLRPDVTAGFKKAYLDDAGYRDYVFTNNVERGYYKLGIAIKDKKGQWKYQLSDEVVRVDVPEYAPAVAANPLKATNDITQYLETLEETEKVIKAGGWAFLKDQASKGNEIYLALNDGDRFYLLETMPINRPDVTANNPAKLNVDNSGFKVQFLRTALPKAKYQISIHIKNKDTKRVSTVSTGREIQL